MWFACVPVACMIDANIHAMYLYVCRLDEISVADKRRWQCAVVEKDGQVAFQIDHLGEAKEV